LARISSGRAIASVTVSPPKKKAQDDSALFHASAVWVYGSKVVESSVAALRNEILLDKAEVLVATNLAREDFLNTEHRDR